VQDMVVACDATVAPQADAIWFLITAFSTLSRDDARPRPTYFLSSEINSTHFTFCSVQKLAILHSLHLVNTAVKV
jgi:hypothetical protein